MVRYNWQVWKPAPHNLKGVCEICRRSYNRVVDNQKRCRPCAKLIRQGKVSGPAREYKGYYVYCWYDMGEKLPCYVGKGKGQRAWRKQLPGIKRTVRVFRDGMTEQEALLVERVLINVFRSLGAKLINKQIPGTRT